MGWGGGGDKEWCACVMVWWWEEDEQQLQQQQQQAEDGATGTATASSTNGTSTSTGSASGVGRRRQLKKYQARAAVEVERGGGRHELHHVHEILGREAGPQSQHRPFVAAWTEDGSERLLPASELGGGGAADPGDPTRSPARGPTSVLWSIETAAASRRSSQRSSSDGGGRGTPTLASSSSLLPLHGRVLTTHTSRPAELRCYGYLWFIDMQQYTQLYDQQCQTFAARSELLPPLQALVAAPDLTKTAFLDIEAVFRSQQAADTAAMRLRNISLDAGAQSEAVENIRKFGARDVSEVIATGMFIEKIRDPPPPGEPLDPGIEWMPITPQAGKAGPGARPGLFPVVAGLLCVAVVAMVGGDRGFGGRRCLR